MNEYYIVQDLPGPYSNGANEIGLKQPPKIGGDWLFDLLKDGSVVQGDCTAPVGDDITSLSELTAANFLRDVSAHLGVG
jgi:hypothetical protein